MSDLLVYSYRYATPLPPIVPTDLSGLTRWYKADDAASITSSAGSVSQWADKAGGNDNLTQATSGLRPVTGTRTLNGRNVLDFDGADFLAASTNLALPLTTFVVARSDISATAVDRTLIGGSGNRCAFYVDSNENLLVYNGSGWTYYTALLDLNAHIWTFSISATTGCFNRFDGAAGNSGPNGSFSSQNITVGGEASVSGWDGVVAEVIQYNRQLADTECLQVETYLATQWGIGAADVLPVSGAVGWWKASDPSTFSYSSGTVVSQWRDKSGLNRHFNQGTVANQPNRNGTHNGASTVVFDGADDYLDTAAFTLNQPATVFIACNATADVSQSFLGSIGDPLQMYVTGAVTGGGVALYVAPSGITDATANANHVGAQIRTFVVDGASSAIYRDGALKVAGSVGSANVTTGLRIAQRDLTANDRFNGALFEIIVYDRVLTTTERQAVQAYLATQWGITVV